MRLEHRDTGHSLTIRRLRGMAANPNVMLLIRPLSCLTVRKQHGRHGRQMRGVHGAAVSVASAPPVVGQRASLGKEVRPATPVGCEHGCAVRVAVRKQAYD